MKKLVFVLIGLVLWSCGEDEETEVMVNNNVPPSQPFLIAPGNNSVFQSEELFYTEVLSFEWSDVTDPDGDFDNYVFFVSDDPTFNMTSFFTTTNSFIQFNTGGPSPEFPSNTSYFWYVRAVDSNGNINESQVWSFFIEDIGAPSPAQLVFPLNETECANEDMTFDWEASTDPLGTNITYELYISTSPSFDSDVDIYETSNTEYTLDLPQGTALYWKVKATNEDGNSSFSEGRSLYVQGVGNTNTVATLEYTSPLNGEVISDQSPQLQWQASDNETSFDQLNFRVYFSEVGEELELVYEDTGISGYEVSGLDFGTTYQWSIWVTDGDGATNVGDVYTFTVE